MIGFQSTHHESSKCDSEGDTKYESECDSKCESKYDCKCDNKRDSDAIVCDDDSAAK